MPKFPIDTIRHSAAHLMAQAISRAFPNQKVQFGVGPVIENGFYYDIEMEHKLTDDDLILIENTMHTIIKEKLPIERQVLTPKEAIDFFKPKGQTLKVELIEGFPANEEITCYRQGEFVDLCRGPHVNNTAEILPYFKIMHTAGAYWKGDQRNQMLQRVYAICFESKKELEEHLKMLNEAKERDHRKLGRELELFHFEPIAPASPFFMPKGAIIYNELIEYMRRVYRVYNYQEVITPQILETALWHTSGHYENYKENMYFTPIEDRDYAVKPMNCPCHMLMFKHYKYSYRDLPLRFADFGRLHRYEKSGAVAGLTRVRSFCQDDAHIFLPLSGVQDEISSLMEMFAFCYEHLGLSKIKINLSTRPEKRMGAEEVWDTAEAALKDALNRSGREYFVKEGDGAFYGPKIDIDVADALGRFHQLGTIQLDFQLPERFDLKFTNSAGEAERPVVIHRALLGSLERFFGVYLEHVAGNFPFWLAPVQAVIIPINDEKHGAAARNLEHQLKFHHNLRVMVDNRNESMGLKTREAQKSKIPFMLVLGDREIESGSVSVRKYGEAKSETLATTDLVALFQKLTSEKFPQKLKDKIESIHR